MNLEDCRRLAMENNKALKMADMQLKNGSGKEERGFLRNICLQ